MKYIWRMATLGDEGTGFATDSIVGSTATTSPSCAKSISGGFNLVALKGTVFVLCSSDVFVDCASPADVLAPIVSVCCTGCVGCTVGVSAWVRISGGVGCRVWTGSWGIVCGGTSSGRRGCSGCIVCTFSVVCPGCLEDRSICKHLLCSWSSTFFQHFLNFHGISLFFLLLARNLFFTWVSTWEISMSAQWKRIRWSKIGGYQISTHYNSIAKPSSQIC